MRDEVIDTVQAETLRPGDFVWMGEIVRVEDSEDGDYIVVSIDGSDDPLRYRWDQWVDLYGDYAVDI